MDRILKLVELVQAVLQSKKSASSPLPQYPSVVAAQANPAGRGQAGLLETHYGILAFWAMGRYRHVLTPDQVWILLDEFFATEGQKAAISERACFRDLCLHLEAFAAMRFADFEL